MICNAEGMSEDRDLLELMGTEKLETWIRLELSVKECEIVYARNLEEAYCCKWLSESREMRTDTQDFKGKIVADNGRYPNTSHLGGTQCEQYCLFNQSLNC